MDEEMFLYRSERSIFICHPKTAAATHRAVWQFWAGTLSKARHTAWLCSALTALHKPQVLSSHICVIAVTTRLLQHQGILRLTHWLTCSKGKAKPVTPVSAKSVCLKIKHFWVFTLLLRPANSNVNQKNDRADHHLTPTRHKLDDF